MKSLLVLVAALSLSVSAIAQDRRHNGRADGRIELNGGQTIVRINVGDERDMDTRAMMRRIAQLERAVRELQNRVYDLEDDARPQTRIVTKYICTYSTTFIDDNHTGEYSDTLFEAQQSAQFACTTNKKSNFFCKDTNPSRFSCNTKQVEVRI